MRTLPVVAACAVFAVAVSGCATSSRYDSMSSAAGVALVYHGAVTRVTDELWWGSFEFNADGCLVVGLEGFDRPMITALPAGSSLSDDGTLVVDGLTFQVNEPVAFGRATLQGFDSEASSIPVACDGDEEIFAVMGMRTRPSGA